MNNSRLETNQQIKLLTFNINGLRDYSKINTLNSLVDELHPDFLLLNEVNTYVPIPTIHNYRHTYSLSLKQTNTNIKSRPSQGVLILSRNTIPIEHSSDSPEYMYHPLLRSRFAFITIRTNNKKRIHIISIYAPAQEELHQNFFTALSSEIAKLALTGDIIIAGDWNAITETEEHEGLTIRSTSIPLVELIAANGLKDACQENQKTDFTCFTNRQDIETRSRIDRIYTSTRLTTTNTKVILNDELVVSDHRPVYTEIEVPNNDKIVTIPRKITTGNFTLVTASKEQVKKAAKEASVVWINQLPNHIRQTYVKDTPLERRTQHLSEALTYTIELLAKDIPNALGKKLTGEGNKPNCNKLIGDRLGKIQWARRATHAAYALLANEPNSEARKNTLKRNLQPPPDVTIEATNNWDLDERQTYVEAIKEIAKLRKQWWKEIRLEETMYRKERRDTMIKELENQFAQNSKILRNGIFKKKAETPDFVYDKNNDLAVTEEEVNKATLEYFQKLHQPKPTDASQLKEKFLPKVTHELGHNRVYDEDIFQPLSETEFDERLQKTNGNRTCGLDGVQGKTLKYLPKSTKEFVRMILSTMIENGEVHESLHQAEIVLLHKKNSKRILANYRGISLLSVLYKIVTGTISKRMESGLRHNKSLSKMQNRCVEGNECAGAVSSVINIMAHATRNDRELAMAGTDIVKAFDRVPIEMLIIILVWLGFGPKVCSFIEHTYKNAKNVARTKYGITEVFEMLTGIRQGDAASPALFRWWFEPLLQYFERHGLGYKWTADNQVHTFPGSAWMDDLHMMANNKEEIATMMSLTLQFLQASAMEIEPSKCYYMSTKDEEDLIVTVDGRQTTIPNTNKTPVRLLGFHLQWDLNFERTKSVMLGAIHTKCEKLRNSVCNLPQTIRLINTDVIPIVRFYIPLLGTHDNHKKLIAAINKPIMQLVNYKGNFHQYIPHEIFFDKKKGLGLMSVLDLWRSEKFNILLNNLNSPNYYCRLLTLLSCNDMEKLLSHRLTSRELSIFPQSTSTPHFPAYLKAAHYAASNLNLHIFRSHALNISNATFGRLMGKSPSKASDPIYKRLKDTPMYYLSPLWTNEPLPPIEHIIIFGSRSTHAITMDTILYDYDMFCQYSKDCPIIIYNNIKRKLINIIQDMVGNVHYLSEHGKQVQVQTTDMLDRSTWNLNTIATDGSLLNTTEGLKAAWAITNGREKIASKSTGIPSILKSELEAILAATYKINTPRTVVPTDSELSINIIKRANQLHPNSHMWRKIPHRSVVREIVLNTNRIPITLRHVKAHTNNTDAWSNLNRIADNYAKAAATNNHAPVLLGTRWQHTDSNYVTDYHNQLIESNPRKLCVNISRNMENDTFTSARKYFWYTNNYIRDTIYNNNNIKDPERNRPFVIKSRSGKLPTNLTTMRTDLPLTYTRCRCGHFTETQVHALEYCTRNRRQIGQKYQSLTQTLASTCRIKNEHASRLITKWKFDRMFRKTIAHSLLPPALAVYLTPE
jgi:exonuclease III